MSDKQRYQEILRGVRSDLKYMETTLFSALVKKVTERSYVIDEETKNWIFDVFLDKLYEIHVKIVTIFEDFGLMEVELPLLDIQSKVQGMAYSIRMGAHRQWYEK